MFIINICTKVLLLLNIWLIIVDIENLRREKLLTTDLKQDN